MKKKFVFLFLLSILLSCGNRPSHNYDAIKSLPSIQQTLQNNGSHFEFVWQTKDSLLLYAQGWQPDTLPRAILCLVHGLGEHSEDRITSVKASHEFSEKAGALCTLKIWEGFFHSLHEEPEKEKIFKYLVTWMSERITQS